MVWVGDSGLLVILLFEFKRVKHKQHYELSIPMSTPTVFGIYGNSDTGKTTLIENLVARLTKEGYKVASIKQTRKTISLDSPNKDTWRHREAGVGLVVFSSRCETDFLVYKALITSEIIQRIFSFGKYDLILVEGANDSYIPKIQLGAGKKRDNTIISYKGNMEEILTLIKREIKKKPLSHRLNITVNGRNIPLTEFPKQIITNILVSMIGSLKGVRDINEVVIELRQ
jgi:molybdopterin-guanine dinucleotide biosynthesis protein MobB